MRPGGFPHLYAEVLSGKALCARYSHELPDHVPGDELDGLWLVVQGQGSESFPNGMLISEQHDGAVALGQRLWCQEGQLKSWSPHFLLVSPNFKCSLPLSWGFYPIQWQGRLAGAQTAGPPRVARALRAAGYSALEHGQMCSVPTNSSESKPSLYLVQILPEGWGRGGRVASVRPFLT